MFGRLLKNWVFLLIGWATVGYAQSDLDTICRVEAISNTCIEAKDGDTIYVGNNNVLFGDEISFCPEKAKVGESKSQIILCLDQSSSMLTTDPNLKANEIAKVFVDSMAARSPESELVIILFGANGTGLAANNAPSMGPFVIGTSVNMFKMFIDSLLQPTVQDNWYGQKGNATPYGSVFDSTLKFFNSMTFDTEVERSVVFLSDGSPRRRRADNILLLYDSTWNQLRSDGLFSKLPPVYTVYFYGSTSSDPNAVSNMKALADSTGGIYTDVSDENQLHAVLIDTIFERVVAKPVKANGFYMLNETTGQVTFGSVLDTSNSTVLTEFNEPMVLAVGANNIVLNYTREIEGETDTIASKNITLYRRTSSVTPAEKAEFDSLFSLRCYSHSKFDFSDSLFVPLGNDSVYNANYANVPIRLSRGPAEDGLVQACSVEVKTAKGDREIIKAIETGNSTNIYHAGIIIQKNNVPVPNNGVLEVSVFDTLYGVYENKNSLANGQYFDVSYDTARVRYLGDVNSIVLYSSVGDPATLSPLGDTVTMTVDNPIPIWAKTFDANNNWIGAVTGADTIRCRWGVTPGNLSNRFTIDIDSLSPNNIFAPTNAPDTATILVTHPATGKKDTVTVIVKAGVTVSLNIESQPNAITSADFVDNIVPFYDNTNSDTVYSVGRDQYGNFCETISSHWTSYNGNGIFNISVTNPSNSAIVNRLSNTDWEGFVVAQATVGNFNIVDTVNVQLYSWHFDSIEIRQNGIPYSNGTINTGQVITLQSLGHRNVDPDTVFIPVDVVWSLSNLFAENNQGGIGSEFTFSPKSPSGGGTIIATKTQTGHAPVLGSTNMIIIPELPTSYVVIPSKTQVSAGEKLDVTVQAYNSDGLYPQTLDTTLFWHSNQKSTPAHISYGVFQWITGSDNIKDTLGSPVLPRTVNMNFVNGIANVSVNLTYAATTDNPTILTISEGSSAGNSPEIIVTSGQLNDIQITDTAFELIKVDTLSNADNNGVRYYVIGVDSFANAVSGVRATWNTTGSIPTFPTSQRNPDSKAVYYATESPGLVSGYIYITAQGRTDSVRIVIRDDKDAIITKVVTRDVNGNGYLDGLELYLSEDASVDSGSGINACFRVVDVYGNTWEVSDIRPYNTRTSVFYLTLVENCTKQTEKTVALGTLLETALLPGVKVNFSDLLKSWDMNSESKVTVDGAGPVIKEAVIYDQATMDNRDDYVVLTWSEPPNSVVGLGKDAEDVFNVWCPKIDSVPEFLRGCELTNMNKISMLNGSRVTDRYWFSIDSVNGGICDRFGNYALKNNRKVRPIFKEMDGVKILSYPVPLDITKLTPNHNSQYNPKFQITLFRDATVFVAIYDMAGNLVRKLPPKEYKGSTESGDRGSTHVIDSWDGTNSRGRKVSRGGYVVRFYIKYKNGKSDVINSNIIVQ